MSEGLKELKHRYENCDRAQENYFNTIKAFDIAANNDLKLAADSGTKTKKKIESVCFQFVFQLKGPVEQN
jgi:hypothetical protein